MIKTPRPNIPKLDIITIGTFDNKGNPIGWKFDGNSHTNSVGEYFSLQKDDGTYEWHLIGGYTIDELREIIKKQ